MKRSPLFLIFFTTLFLLALSVLLSLSRPYVLGHTYRILNSPSLPDPEEIVLANHYLNTGRTELAIQEYQKAFSNLTDSEKIDIYNLLAEIIKLHESVDGQLFLGLVYASWFLPPKLYIFSTILFALFVGIVIIRRFGKNPTFVILPFQDSAGILKEINLPELTQNHLHEITWRTEKPNTSVNLFFDNIEVPLLGLVGDYSHIDSIALIETALSYSFGVSDLPVTKLYNSVKIWLERPKYLVRGHIELDGDTIIITVILINTKDNSVEKVWRSEIKDGQDNPHSDILDVIIFPILHFFTQEPNTTKWEALREFHNGIKEFQIFQNQLFETEHLDKAIQHMRSALRIDHLYDKAAYNLGLFLMTAGDYQNARSYLQEVSTRTEDQNLRNYARYNYGVSLFHLAQDWAYDRAITVFQDLLADDDTTADLAFLVKSTLAMTHAKKSDRDPKKRTDLAQTAINEAKEVLEHPNTSIVAKSNALAATGLAYITLEDFEKAIDYFNKSLLENPTNIAALIGLGDIYDRRGEKEQALEIFGQAEALSPFSDYSSYRAGNIYREQNESEMAINAYKKASKLAVAKLALGKIYFEEGLWAEALDEFKTSTNLNSRLSEGWVNIAWTILELQDDSLYKEAEVAARRALHAEKNKSQLWHRHAVLSRCLSLNKKNEIALKEARKATELGPKQAQAFYYLALAQFNLKQYSSARKSAEKALSLDNKEIWIIDIQILLDRINQAEQDNKQEISDRKQTE